jgi:hypothetical protein
MAFRTTILLLALVVGVMPQPGERRPALRPVLGACATFAPDGTSVGVSIDAENVLLEIAEPSGAVSHLSVALSQSITVTPSERGTKYPCNTYVDSAGGMVAVGIIRPFPPNGRLQIAVADLKALTWIGNWVVGSESGFYSPSLAGFLEATGSIAVTGEPPGTSGRGIQHGSFATLLFDPTGKQLMLAPTTRVYAQETDLFPNTPMRAITGCGLSVPIPSPNPILASRSLLLVLLRLLEMSWSQLGSLRPFRARSAATYGFFPTRLLLPIPTRS